MTVFYFNSGMNNKNIKIKFTVQGMTDVQVVLFEALKASYSLPFNLNRKASK